MIPEYSLTGDLLSFLTCNLQYRYQNKGTLPPSRPIQLWFGEFIHGVMEEAFLDYEIKKTLFPWNWEKDIRPIEEMIDLRLRARGLYPPVDLFCPFRKDSSSEDYEYGNIAKCDDNNHPHKLLASARAESAINIWGPDLFPLIDSAEVLIKGNRDMPNFTDGHSRSNYYGINGVIDVISSMNIDKDYNNSIQKYLFENPDFVKNINSIDCDEYEIIIDYKGMKRPSTKSPNWKYHQWQILTYAWLRSLQPGAKPVVAGIIFYLNELVPSTEDLIAIKRDVDDNHTDVKMDDSEKFKLLNWDEKEVNYIQISDKLKKNRSIRTIIIKEDLISNSLEEFDLVVSEIEKSIINETEGTSIKTAWEANGEKRTCDACDFKTFCKKNSLNDLEIP